MTDKKFYIYMAWHSVTKDPIYVGKGCDGRKDVHNKDAKLGLHYNKFFNDYFAQYGAMQFEIIRNGLSNKEAFQTEIDLIYYFGRKDLGFGTLFNKTDGGEGGAGPKTKEHKANIAKALKGKKRSLEHCKNLSKAKKGKPNPKMSVIATARFKGVPKTPEHNFKNSASQKGRQFTDQHRANIAASKRGKKVALEHIEKRKIAARIRFEQRCLAGTRFHHSEETKAKISVTKARKKAEGLSKCVFH